MKAVYYLNDFIYLFNLLPSLYDPIKKISPELIFKTLLVFDLEKYVDKKHQHLFSQIKYDKEIQERMINFIRFNNFPKEAIIFLICYHFLFYKQLEEKPLAKEITVKPYYFTYLINEKAFFSRLFQMFNNYQGLDLIIDKASNLALKKHKKKVIKENRLVGELPDLVFSLKELVSLLDNIYLKKK